MTTPLSFETMFEAAMLYVYQCARDSKSEKIIEGITEKPKNYGSFWIYDGARVLDNAKNHLINRKEKGIVQTQPTPTIEDLVREIRETPDSDIVYLVNTQHQQTTKIKGSLRNSYKEVDINDLINALPDDFLSYDQSVSKDNIGTRTETAMMAAYVLNQVENSSQARVLIVKDTAYNGTNYGKIAEFGPEGLLQREFFFSRDPNINDNSHTGIYREYNPTKNGVKLESEQKVYITPHGKISYDSSHLKKEQPIALSA